MSDLKELIERELESFIEWDGDDKSIVTTTSAKLFAEHVAKIYADHVAGARKMVAAVQGEPVGEVRFELGAPSSIFAELYSKSLPVLAPGTKLYAAPQPAEQQPQQDVARLIICDECHDKCADPYTGLFASHCPDEEPCIMCECSSLRRQLAEQQPAPDVAGLVEALARCRHEASYSIGEVDALSIQLGKVRDIVNQTLSALAPCRKGGEA